MSTILDYLAALKHGERVWADCPECGEELPWWIPGNQKLIEEDPEYRDEWGLQCDSGNCGYEVSLGPPTILCAVCGEALHRSGDNATAFTCQGCGRRVTA